MLHIWTCEFHLFKSLVLKICSRIMFILYLVSLWGCCFKEGCVKLVVSNTSHSSIVLHCHPQCVCVRRWPLSMTKTHSKDGNHFPEKICMQAISKFCMKTCTNLTSRVNFNMQHYLQEPSEHAAKIKTLVITTFASSILILLTPVLWNSLIWDDCNLCNCQNVSEQQVQSFL